MKVSNKILWVAIGGLFGCVVALLLFIRVSTAPLIDRVEPERSVSGSKQPISQSYPLKYFSGIHASGKWNLKLQRGETYRVEIEAPEYLMGGLIVEKEKDVLNLGLEKGWRLKGGELKARVTMPSLKSLRASGSTTAYMNGFESERLKIRASGSTKLGGAGQQNLLSDSQGFRFNPIGLDGQPGNFCRDRSFRLFNDFREHGRRRFKGQYQRIRNGCLRR